MVPLAVVLAVGVTGTMLALAASQRTADAYGAYQRRADIGDVVINPSWATREIDSVIRSLPGVEQVTVSALLTISPDDGAPRPRAAVDDPDSIPILGAVVGSPDGGYVDMDRPIVVEGRLPTGPDEMVMTAALAEVVGGLEVGDTTPMAFWEGVLLESAVEGDYEAYLAEEVQTVGVEQVELVGIVTMPDEVLPDDLYERGVAILSADLAARYTCPLLDVQVASVTYDEMIAALTETPCASNYLLYSLSMTDGAADVRPALDEYVRRAAALSPQATDAAEEGIEVPAYELFSTETARTSDRVAQAIGPTVTALAVLGAALAAVTIVLACLVAARELRRTRPDQRQWHQLGIGSLQRALVTAVPLVLAVLVGGAVGIATGWLFDRGPVGMVGVVEPDPARRLSGVVLAAVAGLIVVTTLAVVGLALLSARRAARPPGRTEAARLAWRGRIGSPAVADGVGAAYGSRAAIPVVAGVAVLTGTFVATAVFAASLSTLLSTPRAYGWPWDVAAVHNLGYGGLDVDGLAEQLDESADVARWTAFAIQPGWSLKGEPVTAIVGYDATADVDLPVLSGRLPSAPGEIAIGRTTARELGVEVGDQVELHGIEGPSEVVTVTGETVFPTLGPYQAERVSTGSGVLLPEAALPADQRPFAASFVGAELVPGADAAAEERVHDLVAARSGITYVTAFTSAVRPSEIVDARSMLAIPIAVCVVFAIAVAAGLLLASWAATRARRHELAILRALGFSGAHVRTSVRVQSVATMVAAVVLAVPAGVIVGRALWRAFAERLGVVPDPSGAWLPIAGVVVGGLLLAVLAAELPARLAARARPAEGLRSE